MDQDWFDVFFRMDPIPEPFDHIVRYALIAAQVNALKTSRSCDHMTYKADDWS